MEAPREKVLSRIRKMLALANDAAASEGERDNALRMAHATLAKYNLDLSEAETSAPGAAENSEPRIRAQHETVGHAWMRTVYSAVAGLYFCEYYYSRARNGHSHHYFIGRTSNTVTSREIAAFLCASISREASAQARRNAPPHAVNAYVRSFCNGAAAKIFYRCRDLRKEAESESAGPLSKAPGTALVLASVYASEKAANVALMKSEGIVLGVGRGGTRSSRSDAYSAGLAYGAAVHLGRQIK